MMANKQKQALKAFASVIGGDKRAKSVSKGAQKALAKIDVEGIKYKDLAKFGLDDSFTQEQVWELRGMLGGAQSDGKGKKVGRREIKDLANFARRTSFNNQFGKLEDQVDRVVPDVGGEETPVGDAGIKAPRRGALTNLDMSIFGRRAVNRARGARAAIGTSRTGDASFGASLARISLGAM